jgi:hypothetical protein
MPALNRTLRSIRGLIAVAGLSYGLCYCAAQQQQGSQRIYLPDPTPRPPDLHDKYKDDPLERARQQQAAQLRQAQLRQQLTAATDRMAQLAQQLKDEMAKDDKDNSPLSVNAQKAAEIEKLAKTVKNTMKSQ